MSAAERTPARTWSASLGGASFHLLLQISHGGDASCECQHPKGELESQRISRNPGCASQQNPSLALLASWRSATLIRVTHTA